MRGTRLLSVLKFLYRNHADEGVRSLALGAMTDPTLVGLGVLHDYLDENDHPEGERFNFRGAMGKLQRDQEVREELGSLHREIQQRDNPHEDSYVTPNADARTIRGRKGWLRSWSGHVGTLRQIRDRLSHIPRADFFDSVQRVNTNAVDDFDNFGIHGRREGNLDRQKALEDQDARESLYKPTERSSLVNYRRRYAAKSVLPALRRLRSQQQRNLRLTAQRIQDSLGLRPAKTRDALWDSDSHSTNSVAQALYHDSDPDTIRYAAAWWGHLTQAPSVALFHVGEGPDSLYRFSYSGELEQLRSSLAQAGVSQRTLLPRGSGWDCLILDPGRALRKSIDAAAAALGVEEIEESEGVAEVLGEGKTKATAKSRKAYRDLIQTYETERAPRG